MKLTEKQTKKIVKESIIKILKETNEITKKKPKIIKRFENDSDFYIVIIDFNNNTYGISTYDFVNKKYSDTIKNLSKEEALKMAKERNKEYNFS